MDASNPELKIGGITAASVTGLVVSIMALAEAFGWHVFTNDQYAIIAGTVAAVWAVIIPMVLAIRHERHRRERAPDE